MWRLPNTTSVLALVLLLFSSEAGSNEANISEDTSTSIGKEEKVKEEKWLVAIIIIIITILCRQHMRKIFFHSVMKEVVRKGFQWQESEVKIWKMAESTTTAPPINIGADTFPVANSHGGLNIFFTDDY